MPLTVIEDSFDQPVIVILYNASLHNQSDHNKRHMLGWHILF